MYKYACMHNITISHERCTGDQVAHSTLPHISFCQIIYVAAISLKNHAAKYSKNCENLETRKKDYLRQSKGYKHRYDTLTVPM